MKNAFLAFALVFAVIASGCTQQHTCQSPYIVKGIGCCLDQNGNGLCDSDDKPSDGDLVKNYREYEVKMYIQQALPDSESWSKLPPSPAKHNSNYQIYNYEQNATLYDGGWLLLYSNYIEEPITCMVQEYSDSVFYKQQEVRLAREGNSTISGASIKALFPKENTPREVRYAIDCAGDESGIEFQDAYAVSLRL